MKATVMGLQSGKGWSDEQRRVILKFETGASGMSQTATFLESELPGGLSIDDVIEVKFTRDGGK